MADSSDDIYNTYKDCQECGACCTLTVVAMSLKEVHRIQDYIRENGITPVDRGPEICPLRGDDMRCMVYPVRSRTCRMFSCQHPRREIAAKRPEISTPDDLPIFDMRRAFIYGDLRDPRTISLDRILAHYEVQDPKEGR